MMTLKPVKQEIVSPKRYLQIIQESENNIQMVQIRPPQLGSRDFGTFQITYKRPIYKNLVFEN